MTQAAAQAPEDDDNGAAEAGCPATPLEDGRPPGERGRWPLVEQDRIWVSFAFDTSKAVATAALERKRDGTLSQKFGWWRKVNDPRSKGPLRVWGKLLPDGGGLAHVSLADPVPTHPKARFVASGLRFTQPGCWRISAKSGKARLRFVIWVVDQATLPPG